MTDSTVSLVLRFLAGPAGEGRLVGQVEVVATGEVVAVNGAADLVALAGRLVNPPPAAPPEPVG
jgi:hypothetical protein